MGKYTLKKVNAFFIPEGVGCLNLKFAIHKGYFKLSRGILSVHLVAIFVVVLTTYIATLVKAFLRVTFFKPNWADIYGTDWDMVL